MVRFERALSNRAGRLAMPGIPDRLVAESRQSAGRSSPGSIPSRPRANAPGLGAVGSVPTRARVLPRSDSVGAMIGPSVALPVLVRICAARLRQALDLLACGLTACSAGGACARLMVWVRCARTPSRISVHDRAVRPAGDMMVDGVIPLGGALRPLGRWRPSTRTWRQDDAGSRPRCIGVSEGCARKTDFTRVAAPRHRARAGCGSCV